MSQRSGQAPEGEKTSGESACKSRSARGYKAPPEAAAIATAIKERIRAFFTEVGKLAVSKRKDGMQSKIKGNKYKQVGKTRRGEGEAGAACTGICSRVAGMPINTLRYLTPTSLASISDTVDPALGQEVDYVTSRGPLNLYFP